MLLFKLVMAVTERAREIGGWKATGVTRRDIVTQVPQRGRDRIVGRLYA